MVFAITRFEPEDVIHRLAELGLEPEHLLHAARRWHFTWTTFTPNHPPVGVGMACWTEAVAALRDQLLPLGWSRSDERNYALVLNPDQSMAINVAAGDAGTGRPGATPSNKAPKGQTTADAISINQQQFEFDFPVPDVPHIRGEDGPLTWFLLLYRSDREIRAELSLPSAISPDGRITNWRERIILPSVPLDESSLDRNPPVGADIEIDVKRKA